VVLILNMMALMERFTRSRSDRNGARMTGLLSSVTAAQPSLDQLAARMRGAGAGGQA